eukprot:GHVS01064277.1.p1 GENE.GHVS01064277.1~~GHVS01064277.1.p1  ORF type:complete len:336 (+),score=27.53 GHVS01064277.1:301-1308(+)
MLVLLRDFVSSLFLTFYDRFVRSSSWTTKFWNYCYHLTYTFIDADCDHIPFTNYGYEVIPESKSNVDETILRHQSTLKKNIPKDYQKQWPSVNLYAAVLCQAEAHGDGLEDKTMLEVGCGRGGGCIVAHGLPHKPKKYTGVDLCEAGVLRCRVIIDRQKEFSSSDISFCVGDSMALEKQVKCNSQDIVFNVESSHCYPDFLKFLTEVHTVLKPGGMFLWCDLQTHYYMKQIRYAMSYAGLKIINCENISENVARSLKHGSLDELETIYRDEINKKPFVTRSLCSLFWNLFAQMVPNQVVAGRVCYHMVCCKKVVGDELTELRKQIGPFGNAMKSC